MGICDEILGMVVSLGCGGGQRGHAEKYSETLSTSY